MFRPVITFSVNAPPAAVLMEAWESRGGGEPSVSSEPELLADYIQGKRSRDWHISEWREGVNNGFFRAEEFLGVLGMDTEEFRSVFGREPNLQLVRVIDRFEQREKLWHIRLWRKLQIRLGMFKHRVFMSLMRGRITRLLP